MLPLRSPDIYPTAPHHTAGGPGQLSKTQSHSHWGRTFFCPQIHSTAVPAEPSAQRGTLSSFCPGKQLVSPQGSRVRGRGARSSTEITAPHFSALPPVLLPQVLGCAPRAVPRYHRGQEDELNPGTRPYLLPQPWEPVHPRVRCRMPAAMNPEHGGLCAAPRCGTRCRGVRYESRGATCSALSFSQHVASLCAFRAISFSCCLLRRGCGGGRGGICWG